MKLCLLSLCALAGTASAFVVPRRSVQLQQHTTFLQLNTAEQVESEQDSDDHEATKSNVNSVATISAAATTLLLSTPANAVSTELLSLDIPPPVQSAAAAYVHFISLFAVIACLTTERLSLSDNMSEQDQKNIGLADTIYLFAAVGLVGSGYLRATNPALGKGWDFYSHEPVFWIKLALFGVAGAVSLFPTIIFLQRGIEFRNTGSFGPQMSPALQTRLERLLNTQLLAYFSIPLTASLMARGVGYWNDFPWQLGAAVFVVSSLGFSFKYAKEAITWKEPESAGTSSSSTAKSDV